MTPSPPIFCLDLGGTRVKAGVVSGDRVLAARTVPARSHEGLRRQLERLERLLEELASAAGVTAGEVCGLALGFPTLVDARAGRLLAPMGDKYSDVMDIDLAAWARDAFGLALRIENDAHAALLGEWRFGAGRGCDDLVMITLGTGLGSSVIMGGRPIRGRHGQAGVLGGHQVVTPGPDAPRCGCGGRGCVEAEAATAGMVAAARARPEFAASALAGEPDLGFEALFRHAAVGDPLAVRIRGRSLDYWGAAIVGLIHAFDPVRVVIGGGVMGSADTVLAFLRAYVPERAWTPWGRVELVAAELGDHAALLGLGTLFDGRTVEYA